MKKQHYKDVQKAEMVKKICENYATDNFSLANCCRNQGITYKTFHEWVKNDEDFAEMYAEACQKARKNHSQELVKKANIGLDRLLLGEKIEYMEETYKNEFIKKVKENGEEYIENVPVLTNAIKKVKIISPNPNAVMFTLTNLDSENYQNKHSISVKNENLDKLSDAELDQLISELERKTKNQSATDQE